MSKIYIGLRCSEKYPYPHRFFLPPPPIPEIPHPTCPKIPVHFPSKIVAFEIPHSLRISKLWPSMGWVWTLSGTTHCNGPLTVLLKLLSLNWRSSNCQKIEIWVSFYLDVDDMHTNKLNCRCSQMSSFPEVTGYM